MISADCSLYFRVLNQHCWSTIVSMEAIWSNLSGRVQWLHGWTEGFFFICRFDIYSTKQIVLFKSKTFSIRFNNRRSRNIYILALLAFLAISHIHWSVYENHVRKILIHFCWPSILKLLRSLMSILKHTFILDHTVHRQFVVFL